MRAQGQSAPSAQLPPDIQQFLTSHKVLGAAVQRVLMLDQLNALYRRSLEIDDGRPFFERLLSVLRVSAVLSGADAQQIPRVGSVLAVANHPFGFIEGCLLAALLPTIRQDVKIMANSLLSAFPEINSHFIYVNPFGGEEATRANQRGLREALTHLKKGGMLVIFPAGEVAHVNLRKRTITDPEWNGTAVRLARLSNAAVVPMHFSGANSAAFQLLGLIHPRLRTAMLPHEFFNKQNRTIEIRVGAPVAAEKLASIKRDDEAIAYLRARVYLLKHRGRESNANVPLRPAKKPVAIVVPTDPAAMSKEIAALPPDRKLDEMNEFAVYYAEAAEIPATVREIGRLREFTFREAGEGTGKAIDLDAFDSYYLHLFIWNSNTREVIGAYRLGRTDVIHATRGNKSLYTSTLFRFKRSFLDAIGTALEMGRSFVRPEYQRSYTPLLLLWKGIGTYVARNPRYKVLFGPVSISNDYQPVSRQLMVRFFQGQGKDDLTRFVRARSPFRMKPLKQHDDASGTMREWDIEELSVLVADIETDQKGIPVLLRQYLKLGGRLIGFNVDKHFADALDGLILVDLTKTDPKMLQRYLGKEGTSNFLAWHGIVDRKNTALDHRSRLSL
jgi:putative hemolysin